MAKEKCKECSVCTKSTASKIIGAPLKVIPNPVGFFKRKCPVCGHPMSKHKQGGKSD